MSLVFSFEITGFMIKKSYLKLFNYDHLWIAWYLQVSLA